MKLVFTPILVKQNAWNFIYRLKVLVYLLTNKQSLRKAQAEFIVVNIKITSFSDNNKAVLYIF